jgi:hypothetical protein
MREKRLKLAKTRRGQLWLDCKRLWRKLEQPFSRLGLDPELKREHLNKVWWIFELDVIALKLEREDDVAAAQAVLDSLRATATRLETLATEPLSKRLLHGPVRSGWLQPYVRNLELRFRLEQAEIDKRRFKPPGPRSRLSALAS